MPPVESVDRPGAEAPEVTALGHVLSHGRELGEDLLGWVELRIRQTEVEIKESINEQANQLKALAVGAGLAGTGAFLVLVAACLGIGHLLGHPALGFLAVGVFFLAIGGVFLKFLPPTGNVVEEEARMDEKRLSPAAPMGLPVVEEPEPAKPGLGIPAKGLT